ncbi:hypothetical protein D3C87_184440 [compost metagenome]
MKKIFYIICLLFASIVMANAQSIVTLKGKIKFFKTETNACFFVDPDMVKAGVASGLGTKAGNACLDNKYGKGAAINFDGLKIDGEYSTPPKEDVLVEVKGYWKVSISKTKVKTYKFMATEWEPFF